jgi:hypothetical protein
VESPRHKTSITFSAQSHCIKQLRHDHDCAQQINNGDRPNSHAGAVGKTSGGNQLSAVIRKPLTEPVPWRGTELGASPAGQYCLDVTDVAELDAALRAAENVAWEDLSPLTFPLPKLGAALRKVGVELAFGGGVAKLCALPVARYTQLQLGTLYLGLSAYLGTPSEQNGARGLLREIRDRSVTGGRRVDSADALRWHNDRTDIVGLLCVREAARGGVSKLASATAIHNAMLERCPDLLNVLFENFRRFAPGDEVGGTDGYHDLPIFRMHGTMLSTHYSRTYIDQAASLPGGGPLSTAQSRALHELVSIADEFAFEMTLQAGEIQFINNHAILHGRTAFEDEVSGAAQRLLLRVWLSTGAQRTWVA